MTKISPSLLSADFARLGDEMRAAEKAGAHMFHVDVMDGHFVPNITIGPPVVESIKKVTKLPLDVHLMITNPGRYAADFVKAGADMMTVHYEAETHLHRTIQMIKAEGVKAGVSLNPSTPVSVLEDILPELDLVLIMSVNPGFGGQDFIVSSIEKIKRLKSLIDRAGLKTSIEVDGGVKTDNCRMVADAGADILVMGSAFFKSGDYAEFMRRVNEALGN